MIDPRRGRVDLRALAAAELARRSYLPFAQLVDPTFENPTHIEFIARLFEQIERRERRRVILSTPPRHGKSRATQLFAAWLLGRHPGAAIVLASYGAALAERNSRAVRDAVEHPKYPFGDLHLREDSRAVSQWNTTAGGAVIAVGVGGGLTGFGADLLLIDDPVADREAAESALTRNSTWDWYTDTARTRLHPGAAQLVVMTRWHNDDLAGRLIASGSDWEVVNLPAVSEGDGDLLGRPEGEALWPKRFPVDELPSVERGEISARSFAALYQGNPTPTTGTLFRRDWFARRYRELPKVKSAVVYLDCASKTGIANDRSAAALWATDGVDYYVVDVWADRVDFPALRARTIAFFERARERVPETNALLIEDASSGTPLIQELRRTTSLPVVPVKATTSKIIRAESITPLFESAKVVLPETAPWLSEWIEEHAGFPAARHDDMVDTTSGALERLRAVARRTPFGYAAASNAGAPLSYLERFK